MARARVLRGSKWPFLTRHLFARELARAPLSSSRISRKCNFKTHCPASSSWRPDASTGAPSDRAVKNQPYVSLPLLSLSLSLLPSRPKVNFTRAALAHSSSRVAPPQRNISDHHISEIRACCRGGGGRDDGVSRELREWRLERGKGDGELWGVVVVVGQEQSSL